MAFAYYNRLNPAQKRTYRKSDEIISLAIPAGVHAGSLIAQLEQQLKAEQRDSVQQICQALIDALAAGYKVPPLKVSVLAKRPKNHYGELHGLYEPEEEGELAHISIWMRTAELKKVVAFKTFLRTLIHELCHHLDYELYLLEETFHTEGFYKRESTLVNALLTQVQQIKAGNGKI
jgi:hypothetical protein